MAKKEGRTLSTEEKILLDPHVVFGAEATSCFLKTARTCGWRSLAYGPPDWYQQFEIRGGKDVKSLSSESLKVGAIVLEFTDEGRIDRYEVCDDRRVVCCYSPEHSVSYSLSSFHRHRIGEQAISFEFEKPHSSTTSLAPLCRIVVIEPVSG